VILRNIEEDKWRMVISDIIKYEISKIKDKEKRQNIEPILRLSKENIKLNKKILNRAEELNKKGIKPMDALHIASAEYSRADYFITTDTKLIERIRKRKIRVEIKIREPLEFLREVLR